MKAVTSLSRMETVKYETWQRVGFISSIGFHFCFYSTITRLAPVRWYLYVVWSWSRYSTTTVDLWTSWTLNPASNVDQIHGRNWLQVNTQADLRLWPRYTSEHASTLCSLLSVWCVRIMFHRSMTHISESDNGEFIRNENDFDKREYRETRSDGRKN